jgi:hypothetical protein
MEALKINFAVVLFLTASFQFQTNVADKSLAHTNVEAVVNSLSSKPNLVGSTWRYEDDDISYDIIFGEEGVLITTHPNDMTPANDFWRVENQKIRFSFNDEFSVYVGEMVSDNLILGYASNSRFKWKWRAFRVDSKEKTELLSAL